jgi:hypothetical protein
MAGHQPTLYKIFCLIFGEKSPFPISIQSNETVGDLKEVINTRKELVASVFSHELTLYLINIEDGYNLEEKGSERLNSKLTLEELLPTAKLQDLFPEPPKDGIVHILVKVPEGGK